MTYYKSKAWYISPENLFYQLGVIRNVYDGNHEQLIAVMFGKEYSIEVVYLIPCDTIADYATYQEKAKQPCSASALNSYDYLVKKGFM